MCVRIIGVGNTSAADDGAGPAVIEELRARALAGGALLISVGADPLAVIEHLENDAHVIIVDAVRMGKHPGTVLVFPAKNANVRIAAETYSLHGIGLAYALKLAERMKLPAKITIVGIEPETVEPGRPMSETVGRAVAKAADAVLDLIKSTTVAAV